MATGHEQQLREDDILYEQYAKRLEAEHTGAYVAIAHDGRTLVGRTLLAVAQEAKARFGPGSVVFKIGERAVGKWR